MFKYLLHSWVGKVLLIAIVGFLFVAAILTIKNSSPLSTNDDYKVSLMPDKIDLDNISIYDEMINKAFNQVQKNTNLFLGKKGFPQVKRSDISFNPAGFEFDLEIGTTGSGLKTVQVILYDSATNKWTYGYNAKNQTTELVKTDVDNFSDKYSIVIDRIISEYVPEGLENVDFSKGYFVHVTTTDGKDYLIGAFGEVELYERTNSKVLSANVLGILEGIGNIAKKLNPFSFFGKDENTCNNSKVNIWDHVQNALTKRGVTLPLENTIVGQTVTGLSENVLSENSDGGDASSYQHVITCNQVSKIAIPLGSDYSVVPNHDEVVRRYNELGKKQQGAHYLLGGDLHTWCVNGGCYCDFFAELINIETGIVEEMQASDWRLCSNSEKLVEDAIKKIEDVIGKPIKPQDPYWTEPVDDTSKPPVDDDIVVPPVADDNKGTECVDSCSNPAQHGFPVCDLKKLPTSCQPADSRPGWDCYTFEETSCKPSTRCFCIAPPERI